MAAPYVSGTLGLVQQAFPWMSARQMADTVLSTADRSFNAPKSIISVGEDRVTDAGTGKPITKMEIRLQLVDKGADYQNRNQTSIAIPLAGTPEEPAWKPISGSIIRKTRHWFTGIMASKMPTSSLPHSSRPKKTRMRSPSPTAPSMAKFTVPSRTSPSTRFSGRG